MSKKQVQKCSLVMTYERIREKVLVPQTGAWQPCPQMGQGLPWGGYNCLSSGIILLEDMVQDEFRADQGSEKGAMCCR